MIMPIKLTSLQQLEQLNIGTLLKKFPTGKKPEGEFDWKRKEEIDTYEIKAFNRKDNTFKLIQIKGLEELFAWPDDIEYLNISFSKLISEKVWWMMEALDMRTARIAMKENNEILYLTKDGLYLTDDRGNIIAVRQKAKGKDYFQPISIESEAYEKICIQTISRKVCTLWGKDYSCLAWDEVDVCIKSELAPKGFSNIS